MKSRRGFQLVGETAGQVGVLFSYVELGRLGEEILQRGCFSWYDPPAQD